MDLRLEAGGANENRNQDIDVKNVRQSIDEKRAKDAVEAKAVVVRLSLLSPVQARVQGEVDARAEGDDIGGLMMDRLPVRAAPAAVAALIVEGGEEEEGEDMEEDEEDVVIMDGKESVGICRREK